MKPALRKVNLTLHITFSVGWLGAVVCFLALSVAGSQNEETGLVRAADQACRILAWFIIAPLAFGSLVTGLVQSLGTEWGLFRHYWVLTKFFLTIFSTIILLLKMGLIDGIASVSGPVMSDTAMRDGRMELLVHAAGGIAVLLIATALSVFKPWGRTQYGLGKLMERNSLEGTSFPKREANDPRYRRLKIIFTGISVLLLGAILLHLTSGGLGHHGH